MSYRYLRLRLALYGLTHTKCWQCRRWKGLSTRRCCEPCQLSNLLRALFEGASQEIGDVSLGTRQLTGLGERTE